MNDVATILVVDDNPKNLDILFDLLNESGFETLFALDGESALQRAELAELELILLDIMMPGLDGFETCRRLKENQRTCDIPVIFMTALADTINKVRGFELGAVDYITKPIQPEEVLARIYTHLRLQRLQRELALKNEELAESLGRERELNELKSRFVSIASHELRSPLSLIGITTNILKRYYHRLSDEKREEHLQVVEHAVEEMTDLLNNILVLLKVEAGSFQFTPQWVNISELCHTLIKKFQLMSAETHAIRFSGPSQPIHNIVDPKLLQHILSNLLSNALKYSPADHTVDFSLSQQDETIIFHITDYGLGISPDDQQHLFETFYRGENVKQIEGSGLGLSIVKQFVELHDGSIHVESELDQGTTFSVILPLRNDEDG